MDRRILLYAWMGIFAQVSYAQDPRILAVQKADAAWWTAWNQRNIDDLDSLLTADVVYISRTHQLRDKASFLNNVRNGGIGESKGKFPEDDQKIRFVAENVAVVTGSHVDSIGTRGGPSVQVKHIRTVVFVRNAAGKWQMASIHVSVPPARP